MSKTVGVETGSHSARPEARLLILRRSSRDKNPGGFSAFKRHIPSSAIAANSPDHQAASSIDERGRDETNKES